MRGWPIWVSPPAGCLVRPNGRDRKVLLLNYQPLQKDPAREYALIPPLGSADGTATARAMTCKSEGCASSQAVSDRSYDIWDLGEFDQKGEVRTNWGTKDELVHAIKVAADRGIISYIDAVMNHKYVSFGMTCAQNGN